MHLIDLYKFCTHKFFHISLNLVNIFIKILIDKIIQILTCIIKVNPFNLFHTNFSNYSKNDKNIILLNHLPSLPLYIFFSKDEEKDIKSSIN